MSPRDREIVTLRAQGLTLQEIGDLFGLSRQRIAQILNRAAPHTPAHPAATGPTGQRPPVLGGTADTRPRPPSPTPPSAETPAAIGARRVRVRHLLAEGLAPSEIAERLDHRLTTVYADLAWIRAADPHHPPPQ